MKKFKIYLFRHGKTNYNEKGLFTGRVESKITSRGKKDAKKVAMILEKKKIDVAIHTSLSRSKQTLNFVLKFHQECKKIIIDDRMIERSYGDLEGIKHADFIEDMGSKDIKFLKEKADALEDLDPKLKDKLEEMLGEAEYKVIHRSWNIPPPNGESFADVEKRVKDFISWLKKYVRKNKVNVAISAHGNSIRLFRKIIEKASKEETIKWLIPYDKVFTYEI